MEVVIGVEFSARDLRVETDGSAADLRKAIEAAYSSDEKLLWLEDSKGKLVCVPLAKLTYVEIDTEASDKQVGFTRSEKKS